MLSLKLTFLDLGECPYCGKHLDVAVRVEPNCPVQHGDHGICNFCRSTVIAVAVGDQAMRLRRPTADEMKQLNRHVSLSLAICQVMADDLDAMRTKDQKKGE